MGRDARCSLYVEDMLSLEERQRIWGAVQEIWTFEKPVDAILTDPAPFFLELEGDDRIHDEDKTAEALTIEVWSILGRYVPVEVRFLDIENLPWTNHSLDEEEYASFVAQDIDDTEPVAPDGVQGDPNPMNAPHPTQDSPNPQGTRDPTREAPVSAEEADEGVDWEGVSGVEVQTDG